MLKDLCPLLRDRLQKLVSTRKGRMNLLIVKVLYESSYVRIARALRPLSAVSLLLLTLALDLILLALYTTQIQSRLFQDRASLLLTKTSWLT